MSKVRPLSLVDSSDIAIHAVQSQNLTVYKRYRRSDEEHSDEEHSGDIQGTILPPFSGTLAVDKALKWSWKHFKQSIEALIKNNPPVKLEATPLYPTPYILAQFASKAYTDYRQGESERDYEKRLALPEGWKLLTTTCHPGVSNGYFGAAYWHPKHHQVVIAHRGTQPTNWGSDWTDIKGVLFNYYVEQMNSATTFTDRMATVLQAITKEKKVHFQLFFTGHSLGGWLAQITTFTTEYLEKKENQFLKSSIAQKNYHAHTVVFDSPGCKAMLSQMSDSFDVRYGARSIELAALDITSYLSAPNRINTCNTHIGTVYRIFTDLSDMSLLAKRTPVYNLATHSMDKILQAFNPNTGQAGKLQEVVDWPIGAGLSGGEELKNFFKWASHLNDYHPDTMDERFQIKIESGYYPVRYQTKPYDARISRLSLFTQDEKQFLERYCWLRQLSDFFKPEKLFFMVQDVALQRKIQEKLGQFEIVSNAIQCSNADKLQTLVPYVKNLLWLFPKIKGEIKKQANPANIRDRVFQLETRSYLKGIEKNPVDFNPDSLSIEDFLKSDQQIWQLKMLSGDSEIGFIKFYRAFHELNEINSSGYLKNFTALKLSRLLEVSVLMSINKLLKSSEKHLLILASDLYQVTNDDKKILEELFKTLKEKSSIKLVLTTSKSESVPISVLQIVKEIFGNNVIKSTEEQLTWSDLTAESQQKLLARKVEFQGESISLTSLMSAEAQLTIDAKQLADIVENSWIEINNKPIRSDDLQTAYSIEPGDKKIDARHIIDALEAEKELFVVSGLNSEAPAEELMALLPGSVDSQHQALLEHIAAAENVKLQDKKKIILLSCYEGKDCLDRFDALCRDFYASNSEYAKRAIHWVSVKDNQFIWEKSYDFDFYIQRDLRPLNIRDESLNQEEIDEQPVVIVAAEPGMGKSTWLTQWSQKKLDSNWVLRFNLRDLQTALESIDFDNLNIESVSRFLSESAGTNSPWQRLLLQHNLQYRTEKPLRLLWDGFDEIRSKENKDKALKLFKFLKDNTKSRLIITTREIDQQNLEKALEPFSVTFEPLQGDDREKILGKFWQTRLSLIWGRTQCNEIFSNQEHFKFKQYVTPLLHQVDSVLGQKTTSFIGAPLQLQLLAVGFQQDFEQFVRSDAPLAPNHFENFSLNKLYQRFINAKYDLYLKEKAQATSLDSSSQTALKSTYTKAHRQIALHTLFSKEKALELLNNKENPYTLEDLAKVGIIQLINGYPHFVHRTLAEYYATDFLVNQLNKHVLRSSVEKLLLNNILTDYNYQTIRTFLNGQLEEKSLPDTALFKWGEVIAKSWPIASLQKKQSDDMPFHTACREGNGAIINFLIKALEKQPKALKALVEAKDYSKQTALHYAAKSGYTAGIERILTSVRDLKELVKSQDKNGYTLLHWAAKMGQGGFIEWLLPFLKNHQIGVEILEMTDNDGYTSLHLAAQQGKLQAVAALLKNDANIEATGGRDHLTPLHLAAQQGQFEVTEFLLENDANVLAENDYDTVLHRAISGNNIELIKLILDVIKNKWGQQQLSAAINMPDKSDKGDTPLMWAAEKGKAGAAQALLETERINISIKNKKDMTALHWAAKSNHWKVATVLLNHGANINDLNAEQSSSLRDYIEQGNDEHKAQLLERINRHLLSPQRAAAPVIEVAEQTEQILEPMDVDKAGPSCRRRRRDLGGCGEEREGRVFPYEPWERVVSEESYHSQLHAQLALSLVWGHQESVDKWLRYQRYLGEIVEERVENQSPRERGLLRDHYQQALAFFAENPKNRLLQGVDDDFSPAIGESVFLQNGQHSWVVFNAGERYQLYSPDFNYRQRFQTRGGVSWSELSGFMRAFFTWKSGFGEYHPLVLASPLPGKALLQLQEALFWKPEAVAPDRVLLAVRQHGLIEGIPATTVRELISVKGKVVDWTALHADFFQTAGIQLRLDKLHQVLPELTEAQQRILGRLVNHYRWPADSTTLDNCSADERPVLADYQQRVMAELKQAETITPERLSELSWQALGQAIEEQPELPEELKQPVLDNLKAMHSTTTRRAWAKGMATQSLFFLPDMIRAANTGQVGGLAGTAGMLAADGGVNHLYGRLLERLAPTLGEARLGLLRKLPITSPVFKALTVYSIVELTKQLHSLPADSEQRKTIRHRLGEQYVTIGIMAAELLGLETGPLWIGLMAEQLIFEAITFRKENQLDIPFWEALIMSLGFEQNKLQHIVEERQLVDVNLATVDNINTQANPPYGWVLIKIPLLGPLVWTSLAESQIPRNISAEILQQPAPFSFDVATEVRESKGFRQVRQFKTRLYPAYNAAVATRGELIETQWQRGIYHATSASTRIDVVPIGPHCQEDNIFLDSPKGLVSYKRVASVMGDSYRFCPPHGPIKIKGPGLSALYANNQTFTNQNAQRNLYLGFDPCEGDITLHFFPAGLQQLDVINRQHNPQYSPDLNQPYSITIQVGHKNYPDSILFSQEGSLLTLNDPTRRINSHYFIDYDTRPFRIRDDATVTRVAFNPTQSLGYRLQSDGPEIIRLYPPQGDTFSTLWLKGPKQQLQLRLGQQRIANVLMLSAEQVEIFSAHGEDAYRSGIYLTNHVTRFALTVVGNVQIMQKQTHLFVIGEHPDNTPAIHYTKNPGMPYQLTLATLQPVVETLHRPNPQECHFTTPGILYSWLPGEQSTATLQIVGGYQGQLAQLLLERDNATLSQSAFHQPTRTLVVFHFTDSVALDHQLRLQQVLPANHTGPGLQFQSPQGDEVLHYFEHDRFTINGIHYQMHGKRLYATGAESGVIEGKQLIRDRHPGQGVGIRIHSSLNQSVLARDNQTWSINQLKLHQLPERTLIYFEHQTFPWQALQETPQHPHRHHHQSRHRRQIPNVASSAQRPTSWITNLWKGLLGRFPTDTRPSLPQPSVSLTPSEYTAEHLQGGLQLLDLVIRKWTGKKYSPPTLTIDFDTDDNRRTMASQLAYAAQCPTVTTLKQSLATENHESHATTPQEPWLAYPLPTTDTHNLTRQLT